MIKLIKLPEPHTATVIIASGEDLALVMAAIYGYASCYNVYEKSPWNKPVYDAIIDSRYHFYLTDGMHRGTNPINLKPLPDITF